MDSSFIFQRTPKIIRDTAGGVKIYRGLLLRVLAVIVAILLWNLYASTQPEYLFPTASSIGSAFLEQYQNYDLTSAFLGSMRTLAVGFFIGVIVGIPIGLLMGVNRYVEVALDPLVTIMFVAPISALVPIFIFIGGATEGTRIAIVFMFVVFEVLITTYKGAKSTPRGAIDVAKSFGAGPVYTVRNVVIPHDLPYISTGLRLGIGRGIKGLILAELLIEFVNLGAIIRTFQHLFMVQGILSVALLLMVLGIILTKTLQLVENHLFRWRVENQ